MLKATIASATISLGVVLVSIPATADDIHGGPIRKGNQCFQLSTTQAVKDARFGYWAACPEAASASVARPAVQRRTNRHNSASR